MKNNKIFLYIILFSFFSGLLWGLISFLVLSSWTSENETINQKNASISNIHMSSLENTITSLAKEISPSVVSIVIKKDLPLLRENPFGFYRTSIWSIETEVWWGTGFFVDKNGTIVTNKHVVSDSNARYSVVLNNWKDYDAQVLALDSVNDLAIIKIDYESTPLEVISKESETNIGQFVVAIGNALSEFQNSVSFGVVSGKNRIIQAQWQKLSSLIQTDTAINPWNSWWPLIDMSGKVVGINTAIASGQGLGFSIELSQEKIAYMLESIEKYGEIKKPFIGVYYIPINSVVADELWSPYEYGIYVPTENDSVIEGSAAEKAGIKPWDIILEADGQIINQENSLDVVLQNKFPGEIIEFKILRNWEVKNLNLILGKQ